jgi:hypothetical protein
LRQTSELATASIARIIIGRIFNLAPRKGKIDKHNPKNRLTCSLFKGMIPRTIRPDSKVLDIEGEPYASTQPSFINEDTSTQTSAGLRFSGASGLLPDVPDRCAND